MRKFQLAVLGVMAISPLCLKAEDPPSPFSPDLIKLFTPADNPYSEAKAKLGDKLFDDKRLSVDDTVACNTCHVPRTGFTVQIETAKGVRDQLASATLPRCSTPCSSPASSGMGARPR